MQSVSWRLVGNLIVLGMTLAGAPRSQAQTEVLTRSYDNSRTGANLSEKVLSPQSVRKLGLKRRFKIELTQDDQRVEAQPLYMPGLLMKDGKKHDVLFLFSMGNKAYALDINTASNIWTTSLGPPFRPDPHDPVDSHHINTSFGILSTLPTRSIAGWSMMLPRARFAPKLIVVALAIAATVPTAVLAQQIEFQIRSADPADD
jgi:hypothetical protein